MKISKKRFIGIFVPSILVAVILTTLIVQAQAPSQTFTIDTRSGYPGAPSYTISTDGTYYYTKDNFGAIIWSSTNLNTALSHLNIANTHIVFGDGNFILSARWDITVSNITVEGDGWATRLVLANGVNNHMIYVSGGVSGVHIKNLSLDGYKTGQTAGVGINFDGIYDSSIENILTLNIYENAITLNNVFRVTVKNCRFTYSGDNDVYVTGSAEVKILDNSMESAGISGIYAYNNARGILAQGNDILDSGKWGIDYYLTPESEIIGNHIRNIADGTDRDGIAIKYSYYVTVSGNTCEHNGDTGIALLDTKFDTVTGNTITLAYFNGIYGMAAQYNTISGNILTDNGRYANGTLDGLTLEDTGGFSSSYNTITGNVAYDDQTPHIQAWGFRELSGANVNSFVNDNCFNNAVGGILKIGANSNVHLFYNNTFSAWVS